ncbi:hypothetical protein E1B28_008380 [Marasmius oreades]|uniref:Uncharacterized protein n=1 Tax=Marasmius oreades TaxID=181124 RepID=A0A9P7RZV2_9AGAR|nr:uncharacterized protein E1B28_008380 [Marasmius oreades]KAG7091993.1 hypothetical protein E1B28_008380 [Marasmius oreades]
MQAVALYTKFTPQRTAAIREGLRIIRHIFSSNDASKEGLSTSEIYRLALKEKPGKEFLDSLKQANANGKGKGISSGVQSKLEDGRIQPPAPPNPEHPLKSMTFLKKDVLPILEGNQEIRLQKTSRLPIVHTSESTATNTPTKGKNEKGPKKQKPVDKQLSSSTPPPASPVTVWLWKQFRTTRPDSSIREYNGPWKKTRLGELGITVNPVLDTGHLNRRRRFARYEKLARESAVRSREERRVANGTEKEPFTTSELARIAKNSRDGARKLKLF